MDAAAPARINSVFLAPFFLGYDEIFRRSDAVAGVVDEALAHLPQLQVIWTQIGVRDDAAAQKARDAGITVIQDRCPKIEFPRHI